MASSAEPPRRTRGWTGILWTVLLLALILGLLRLKPLTAIAPALRAALFVVGPVGILVLVSLIGVSLWRRSRRAGS